MTKDNTYKPTVAEKRLLEVLLNPENLGKSVTELCNLAEVSRNKYYDAMKKEDFVELVSETSQELVMAKIGDVVNATYKYALSEKGHQDRKMLLTMAGIFVEKTEATVNANVKHQNSAYDELTAEELRRLIGDG